MKLLTAIPVYNEERHLEGVLHEVRRYSPHILVVNDGSTDRTVDLLARQSDLSVITHPGNQGYGAAAGSTTRNAAPLNSPSTSVISPPQSSAFFLAIDNPSPIPFFLNVIVGLKSERDASSFRPGPES